MYSKRGVEMPRSLTALMQVKGISLEMFCQREVCICLFFYEFSYRKLRHLSLAAEQGDKYTVAPVQCER